MFCRKTYYLKVQKNNLKTCRNGFNSDESYMKILVRNNEASFLSKECILPTKIYKAMTDNSVEVIYS